MRTTTVTKDLPLPLSLEEARIAAAYARRHEDGRYSWFNPSYVLVMHDIERRLLDMLGRSGIRSMADVQSLEIGCGTGYWLGRMVAWGARPDRVLGIELLEGRVASAQHRCPPGVRVLQGNAARLAFPAHSFDLVFQMLVFSSVLDPETRRWMAREMRRVLRPGGAIVWYDYHVRSPRNPDVRAVTRREIVDLFPDCGIELRRATLAPPIGRAVARYGTWLYRALDAVPLLRTHYLGLIRPRVHDSGAPDA